MGVFLGGTLLEEPGKTKLEKKDKSAEKKQGARQKIYRRGSWGWGQRTEQTAGEFDLG